MTFRKVGRLENKKDFEIFFAQEIPSKKKKATTLVDNTALLMTEQLF